MTELTKTHLRALSEILDRNERRAPEAARLRVLQDKLGKIISEADEETRDTLFAVTEAFATKSQARKIAEHPLRGERGRRCSRRDSNSEQRGQF